MRNAFEGLTEKQALFTSAHIWALATATTLTLSSAVSRAYGRMRPSRLRRPSSP